MQRRLATEALILCGNRDRESENKSEIQEGMGVLPPLYRKGESPIME